MTDYIPLIIAVLAGAIVIYLVDDGRIRVAVFSVILGWGIWRNRQANLDSSKPNSVQNGNSSIAPIIPDTTQVDQDAHDTDVRLDAVDDTRPGGNVGAALDDLDEYDREQSKVSNSR